MLRKHILNPRINHFLRKFLSLHKFSTQVKINFFVYCILLSILFVTLVSADVRLPSVISSGMVLQQNDSVAIWGWAENNQKIEVTPGWSRDKYTVISGTDGKWMMEIKTPSAGGPYTITVNGGNEVILRDILIGEVWLCSGQSNMEMSLGPVNQWQPGVMNYEKELADSNYPQIRFFTVPRKSSAEMQQDCQAQWAKCNRETVAPFSAVAYFFGKRLHKNLNIPIGLIMSAHGGTPCQSWTEMKFMRSHEAFGSLLEEYDNACERYPEALKEWEIKVKQWEISAKEMRARGDIPPQKPWQPMGPGNQHAPASLFNGMISPILPYSIRGVIWYQGEANARRAFEYRFIFPAMIQNWREEWNDPDMPFFYVQIAPWQYSEPDIAAELREAQLITMNIMPYTGMVVTTDLVDNVDDIHPENKRPVGERLALWALANVYNQGDIIFSGPVYKSMNIEGEKIRIFFDYVDGGLVAKNGELTHFELAGDNEIFFPADATVDGKTVLIYSDLVKNPKNVRFGWSNTAQPNLFNNAGLPASPFRTDNFPLATEK